MIKKMTVETWDGRSKIIAELDVVKEIDDKHVIIRTFSNYMKEMIFDETDNVWKIKKEFVDENS